MNEEEPCLRRWSRRKAEAKEVRQPEAEPRPADRPTTAAHEDERRAKRELTEADFADVDFEALDAKSDYARFLQPGVPASIKHKALRKLWLSDPVLWRWHPAR
jgi:hypothetical protein